ncbi:CPBP family intramembrane glutamic endopeptidase [Brevibacillus sp. SYSU BS000544]|uniref:CPBP family intramembrane glutamic endopeptidase n=1 Tax=Brevibacillus sp. SYSU BS000544 TaxID=3416443 RepID=UPI003CE59C71
MYTGLQLRHVTPWSHRTRRWALLLCIGYGLNLLMELLMLRFSIGEDGQWVVSTQTDLDTWMVLFIMAVGVFCWTGLIGFVISYFREQRETQYFWYEDCVTGTDFLYTIAWLQVFSTILLTGYAFFFSYPIFSEGSVAGIIETASIQLFILIVAILMFHGRWHVIGFTRPNHLGQMLLGILIIMGFIFFALDAYLTNPIADYFNLSLESEREQGIQQGIVQAKSSNWLNGIVSIAVVGVFVPIAEEILFRGVIQTYLVRKWGAIIGIVATSFWFAIMHVDIALFLPLFVIGLGLGFVRHRYQSIWGAILLHSLNNLASAMQYFT